MGRKQRHIEDDTARLVIDAILDIEQQEPQLKGVRRVDLLDHASLQHIESTTVDRYVALLSEHGRIRKIPDLMDMRSVRYILDFSALEVSQ